MSQTTLPQCAHRLSAGFFDESIGLQFEVHHPRARPDVWAEYLTGAIEIYEKHGVGEAIRRAHLEDGDGVSMFFVGRRADGKVAAGVRCHGPLDRLEDSQSLREMATSSEAAWLTDQVAKFLPFGVVEIKGAWSAIRGPGPHAMFR